MRAKELIGDAWFGTDKRLGLVDFKGRYLLLDFWTLCCVNCHHVLAELRPLEEKFADVLSVVGIHSPKFEHEKNPAAIRAAIDRHDIPHLVLNDPNMSTWEAYGVRAWPTLVLIDPAGQVIGTFSGEGHGHAIDALISSTIGEYQKSGELTPGAFEVEFDRQPAAVLNQPGKLAVIPEQYRKHFFGAELLVSNSGSHELVAFSADNLAKPLQRIGAGTRGVSDGDLETAHFNEPYGLVFLPEPLAAALGIELLVADTANHIIRGISLATGTVRTIAGTGKQWMQNDATQGSAKTINLSTPWDITLQGQQLLIAMAGEHRIWSLDLVSEQIGVLAGTSHEGLQDGGLETSWFAQPSAVCASATDPDIVWVIDAETSALRRLSGATVTTAIGKGLFEFGHVDGPGSQALLQHPLGLTELPNGQLVIADSYNQSLRIYDPASRNVSTLVRDLLEPSDVVFLDGALFVAESSGNRITKLPVAESQFVAGDRYKTIRPASQLASGEVELEVVFVPPPGQKIDLRYGPATYLSVSASPPELLLAGSGNSPELTRLIHLNPNVGEGVIHVAAKGASCDSEGDHAACHIHQQDWGIPIKVTASGDQTLRLSLSGSKAPESETETP